MKQYQQILILLGLCGLTFFAHLDEFAPDLMESRNFIAAREMLVEGNWISPTMNGEPRLEKPPLPTWMTAWCAQYLGGLDSPFAMRLPGAILATLMVLFFFGFCRELSKEKYLPLLGGAIMATSMLVIQQARTNSWDIHTHAFMMGSIWMLYRGWKHGRWSSFLLAALLLGASILSKGPVSLYALWLPFMLAFGITDKEGLLKKYWKQTLVVFLLGFLIGFGWNIYIYFELPKVMEYVVDKETNSWGDRHVRPIYFYLHFAIYIGIWAVFMIASFFYKYAAPRVNRYGNYRFVIFWVLIVVFLLSVIPTKKERYLLPAMIPMALMVTYLVYAILKAFQNRTAEKWDRIVITIFSVIVFSAAVVLPILGNFILDGFTSDILFVISTIVIGSIGLLGFYFLKLKNIRGIILSGMAIVAVVCSGLTPQLSEVYYRYPGYKGIGEIREIPELDGLPLYTNMKNVNMQLVWSAGQPVRYIEMTPDSISAHTPFVFIGDSPFSEFVSDSAFAQWEVMDYGIYDYFRKDSKYKAHVSLISHEEN
jgi:4-amino-4-deoxy-L-arabinose transferase-like glycosyltransferase